MRNPNNKQLPSINLSAGKIDIRLGSVISAYGYPTKFGSGLTYTSGDFSGTEDSGVWIKTTAILEHGNSGGGAYLQDGTFVGIPTSVAKGELNSMGYLLSINAVNSWLNNSPMAYSGSANSYARVSAIEDIDTSKLGTMKVFFPETDTKGSPVIGKDGQPKGFVANAPVEATASKATPEKKSIVVEEENDSASSTADTASATTPKRGFVSRIIGWVMGLFAWDR